MKPKIVVGFVPMWMGFIFTYQGFLFVVGGGTLAGLFVPAGVLSLISGIIMVALGLMLLIFGDAAASQESWS